MVEMREQFGLLLVTAALLCALVGCKGAQTAGSLGDDGKGGDTRSVAMIPPVDDTTLLAPMSPQAGVGDQFEIVIRRPDRAKPQQRIRAVVQTGGKMAVVGLGVFDAAGMTFRQLEQNLIDALNRDGTLQGTLRMSPAPIAHSGLFLAAPLGEFANVVGDKTQLDQLDRDEHPKWQWVQIDADLHQRLSGTQQLYTIHRNDQRLTLARPAHPELVNDRLAQNVATAWAQRSAEPTVSVELRPGAAMAMENVTRENAHRPLLIVIDNKIVLVPMIYTVVRNKLVLTDAMAALNVGDRQLIAWVFNTEPKP